MDIKRYHMVSIGNMMLIGQLADNGNTLCRPRIFQYSEGGKRFDLIPLPSLPESVPVENKNFAYPVRPNDKIVISIYERITSKEAEDEAIASMEKGPKEGSK